MKGKLIAFSLTLALLLSVLSVAGVGAHPVTIEAPNFVASRAEWFGQQPDFSGGAYVQRNKAQQGELIFKDITGSKTPDQRLIISSTSVVTRAGDLAWFGVTADGAGQTALPDGVTTNGVPTNVPADAAWEYTVDTKFSPGNGTVPYVNGTTKIFTNGTTSTNCDLTTCPSQLAGASVPQGSFAEIAVPWSQIGGQPLGGAFLRLTVSLMYSSRQSPSDGTSSPIIDVLGTTSTLADLQDKTLDTAIDVHFDPANNFEVYAPLLITEFYPNPVGKDAPGPTSPSNETEWIEIYNPNAFAVALSDYKIGNAAKRGSSKGMFKFNSGSIPAKGAAGNPIVVAVDKTRFLDGHPGFNASTVYGLTNDLTKYSAWASDTTISLDNGPTPPATTFNDQVVLLDAKDDIVDMIEYGTPTAPHPGNLPIVLSTSTVPEGVSYERCPAGVDTNGGYDPITPAASNIDFIVRGVPAETTPGVACQGVPGVNVQVVKTSGLTSASPGDLVPFTITYSSPTRCRTV